MQNPWIAPVLCVQAYSPKAERFPGRGLADRQGIWGVLQGYSGKARVIVQEGIGGQTGRT